MSEEKHFEPSKRRLEKARRDGKVLKSPIIAQTVLITVCIISLFLWVRLSWVRIQMLLEYTLIMGAARPLVCLRESLNVLLEAVLTCLIPSCLAVAAAEGLQAGVRLDLGILKPRASRLSAAQGFRGIVAGVGQVWQPVLRLALFAALLFLLCRASAQIWMSFDAVTERLAVLRSYAGMFVAVIAAGWVSMAVAAALDYLLRRRRFLRELSMSASEMRSECREEEGDPYMKSARKSMHESLLMQDIVRRVRKARVIVVEQN